MDEFNPGAMRSIREAKGVTFWDLGKMVRKSIAEKIERGDYYPTMEQVYRIAFVLGVPVDALMTPAAVVTEPVVEVTPSASAMDALLPFIRSTQPVAIAFYA